MPRTIVLCNQDLRLDDNPALSGAAARGVVLPLFVYDPQAGGGPPMGGASRWWLHHSLTALRAAYADRGVSLILRRGPVDSVVHDLVAECGADAVYWNRTYEPASIALLKRLKLGLAGRGIEARGFKAGLLFEPWEIKTRQGDPFRVFTPFWKQCQRQATVADPLPAPRLPASDRDWPSDSLDSWGLLPTHPDWSSGLQATWMPGEAAARARLADFLSTRLSLYADQRDRPAAAMSSGLSPHLHWGEVSPRTVWHAIGRATESAGQARNVEKFRAELGWREFAHALLYHWPTLVDQPFNPGFADFAWRSDPAGLRAWQRGRTGYPIVDAGMRALWHTGTLHNRVRMIVASFLTKHLLISWQDGAAWFWDTLVDADLANNCAGWQWVAGCGADAAPYFRIFNPTLQGERFDPQGHYVRRWVPELAGLPDSHIHHPWDADVSVLRRAGVVLDRTYPAPIIAHSTARLRALAAFKARVASGIGP